MLGGAGTGRAASSLSDPRTSAAGDGSSPETIEQIEEQLLRQAIAASLEAVSCGSADSGTHEAVERPAAPPQLPTAPLDVVAALAASPASAAEHSKDTKSAPSTAPASLLPGGSSEGQHRSSESALFGDEPLPARLNGLDGASGDGDEEQLMLETAIRMSLIEVTANEASTLLHTAPATAADLPPDVASAPAPTQSAPPDVNDFGLLF